MISGRTSESGDGGGEYNIQRGQYVSSVFTTE